MRGIGDEGAIINIATVAAGLGEMYMVLHSGVPYTGDHTRSVGGVGGRRCGEMGERGEEMG